jgi:hypothetical protein
MMMKKLKLNPLEKIELNKIGNTESIMGEKTELKSMFGNPKITALRKSLLRKGFLKKITPITLTDGTKVERVTLSKLGLNWYYAKGKMKKVV